MTQAAVKETETKLDTQGESSDETQAGLDEKSKQGTDAQKEQQTSNGKGALTVEDKASDKDALDFSQIHKESEEAKAQLTKEEIREEARRLRDEEKAEDERKAREQVIKDAVPNAILKVRAQAEASELSTAEADALVKIVEGLGLNIRPHIRDQLIEEYNAAINAALPEDKRDEYWEEVGKAQGGTITAKDAIHLAAEYIALESKAFKSLSLEELSEKLPKLKAELTANNESWFEKGREKGRKDPDGEPTDKGVQSVGSGGWDYNRYMKATPTERRDLAREHPEIEAQIIKDAQRAGRR